MRLSAEDIILVMAALNRAITRYESEARYAESGRGANNLKTVKEKAKKMKELRKRILQSSGVDVMES